MQKTKTVIIITGAIAGLILATRSLLNRSRASSRYEKDIGQHRDVRGRFAGQGNRWDPKARRNRTPLGCYAVERG